MCNKISVCLPFCRHSILADCSSLSAGNLPHQNDKFINRFHNLIKYVVCCLLYFDIVELVHGRVSSLISLQKSRSEVFCETVHGSITPQANPGKPENGCVQVTHSDCEVTVFILLMWQAAVSMLKQEYKEGETNLQQALDLSIKVLSKTLDTNKLTADKGA